MSAGVVLLVVILLGVAAIWLMQRRLAGIAQAMVGREAPVLPGMEAVEGRLLWFHAPGCAPCQAMHDDVERLGAQVLSLDVRTRPDVARAYGIMATPTTVRVRDGHIAAVRVGRLVRSQLDQMLSD